MFKHFSLTRIRRELSKFWPWLRLALISTFVILIGFGLTKIIPPTVTLVQKMLLKPQTFISFAKNPADVLKNTSDRTNILMMGIRGQGVGDGALLTDSMMLVSYNHVDKNISLISIPRDIWVESMKAKINTGYYYGEQKQPGKGLDNAKSVVSEVMGLPIHYGIILNFDGFQKAIDVIGGIDLTVDHTLDDLKYPIPGQENALPISDRYERLHIDAGPQHMDGVVSLKFVRSRNAVGDEGTDFARDARQQKVIVAFEQKLLTDKIYLDQAKLSQLIDIFHQYVVTDVVPDDYGAFAKMFLLGSDNQIKTVVLSTGDPSTKTIGILQNPKDRTPYGGQYVLIARDNNWMALQQYIQNELVKWPWMLQLDYLSAPWLEYNFPQFLNRSLVDMIVSSLDIPQDNILNLVSPNNFFWVLWLWVFIDLHHISRPLARYLETASP